jgi:23S rRNA (adenine2503-C2)-methyltransferase
VADLVEAAGWFERTTGRRVTFEYVAIRGVNTDPKLADDLAKLVKGTRHHVNVIPLNPVEGLPYRRPTEEELEAFTAALDRRGVNYTLRRPRGESISAACGQLRHRHRPN